MEVPVAPTVAEELRAILDEGRRASDDLAARLEHGAEPGEVVGLLEAIALIDQRRAHLLEHYRSAASDNRKREEERSIRWFVLQALERIGLPQTTGFLEDYLYATELLEAKSRGMGALRRDEYRAWDRRGDRPRVAYIVPCLDEDGRAVPRWMARSDWPLHSRIVVPGAEELWSLHRVLALLDAHRTADPDTDALFVTSIEEYAREVLGEELADNEELDPFSEELRNVVEKRFASIEAPVIASQQRHADRFHDWDERHRLWGAGAR